MTRLAALLVLLLGLAACGRGPDAEQVRQDLENRISQVFSPGTFEVVWFDERGSSADSNSPPGENRRVVYYETRLKLTRDVDFGAWNTPGAASLVTLMGAGPKGIRGVISGGNQAGDEIRAFGTAVYRPDGGGWKEIAPAGFTPPVVPALVTISPPPASEQLLANLREIATASPAGSTPAGQAIIDQELSRSLATIQARLSRITQVYAIAAGPERGQYARLVQALALTKPLGLNFQPLLTAGSVENLELLDEDRISLALAQADVAHQAFAGQGPFASRGPSPELRSLGSLYPEFLHVIVRADSPAHSIADLIHKRVSLGPPGSGTRITAEHVLDAYGMQRGR
ncbi:MAG: TAXI family TRAP transporter solute-binding subunit, partial [Acetobacteraceae bacterium]|nr:TAXI family TRAP transporter solute-binding subunit [Acetobacteraceae bacterium]